VHKHNLILNQTNFKAFHEHSCLMAEKLR